MRGHSLCLALMATRQPSDRGRLEAGGGLVLARGAMPSRCRFTCRPGDGSDAGSVSVRVVDPVFVRVAGHARPRAAPSFESGLVGLSGHSAAADVVRDFWKLPRQDLAAFLGR